MAGPRGARGTAKLIQPQPRARAGLEEAGLADRGRPKYHHPHPQHTFTAKGCGRGYERPPQGRTQSLVGGPGHMGLRSRTGGPCAQQAVPAQPMPAQPNLSYIRRRDLFRKLIHLCIFAYSILGSLPFFPFAS